MTALLHTPPVDGQDRTRVMRPAGDHLDVIDRHWNRHHSESRFAGHWSENVIGRIEPGSDLKWRALFRGEYDMGDYGTAKGAALAIWAAYVQEGRAIREQIEYERANGWSTD